MDRVCFGLASGAVVVVGLGDGFQPSFDFAAFERKGVVYAQDRFAGDARNRLPVRTLREKYAFGNLEQLLAYLEAQKRNFGACTRLCVCFIGDSLKLV